MMNRDNEFEYAEDLASTAAMPATPPADQVAPAADPGDTAGDDPPTAVMPATPPADQVAPTGAAGDTATDDAPTAAMPATLAPDEVAPIGAAGGSPAAEDPDAAAGDTPGAAAATAAGAHTAYAQPVPDYRRGPAVGTVVLGAVLLLGAAATLVAQLRDTPLAITVAAPYALVAVGLLIALGGALAALGRRRPGAR